MDEMDEAVDLALLYGVTVLPPEAASQVEVLQRCAELTTNAMPRLRSMQDLNEYWIEINRLENQGDKSHRRILASLFNGQRSEEHTSELQSLMRRSYAVF